MCVCVCVCVCVLWTVPEYVIIYSKLSSKCNNITCKLQKLPFASYIIVYLSAISYKSSSFFESCVELVYT